MGRAPLAPDKGYVLLHVVTDIPIEYVTISGGRIAEALPRGSAAWLIELPAGRYAWRRIKPAASTGTQHLIDLSDYRALRRVEDWVWDDEYEFDVIAGAVNYPGTLIVNSDPASRSSRYCCFVRVRNRSAIDLRAVLDDYGAIIDRFPIRHGGAGKDRFLSHYSEVRDRLKRSAQAEEGG
ncbi:MAG: hypothetical protein NXI30_20165 [bacterium]|nr:hypothetical protein [bacterium]